MVDAARTLFLGVDAGGTSTRVVALDEHGKTVARARAGSGNPREVGVDGFARALTQALADARLNAESLRGAFLGIAGVATEAARLAVERAVAPILSGVPLEVDTDLRIAHAGALGGQPGIVLIAGTGSSCYGRDAEGRSARAGGFGYVLDDRGGGYDLGRQGLIAVVRAEDGRAPRTRLWERLRDHLALTEVRDVLAVADGSPASRARVAALAPLVVEEAHRGDDAARSILLFGARELALCVHAVAQRLGGFDPAVVLVGGLADAAPYRERILEALHGFLPEARVHDALTTPVHGAALLALQRAVGDLPPEVLEQVRLSSPGQKHHE